MTRLHTALRIPALLMVTLALSGCITLFPKTKPAQLYTFGYTASDAGSAPTSRETVRVLKLASSFTRPSAGDQILTVTGGSDVAYMAQARWVSAASVLFDEAVNRAFDQGGPARLVGRGDMGRSDYALKLTVADFKVAYDQPKSKPSVVITVQASLTRTSDRALAAERTFSQSVPLADNRQSDIVAGFNTALSGVLSEVVTWTGALGQTGG